ncbi:MAG: HD domain protein [Syntrophaceae bacterium PtaU1.Bin231]|nr:MAG: HD domain protein [Syntrophaceae bacterium PtaU1.Bin231]HOG17765.1 HD domain-containing protein [Syntrophales bacterium]
MNVPSREECYRIMIGMSMPDHIVAHSFQVCRIAVLLAKSRAAVNGALHLGLVEASALLHDITKARSFQTGEDHARSGGVYLAELGYPDVAGVIGQHVRLEAYFASETVSEAEIVNYADKRVVHDRIVPLEERIVYLLEHYGTEEPWRSRILMLAEKAREMESRIFLGLPFAPGEIERKIAGDDRLQVYSSIRQQLDVEVS